MRTVYDGIVGGEASFTSSAKGILETNLPSDRASAIWPFKFLNMKNTRDYHFRGKVKFRCLELKEESAKLFIDAIPESKYMENYRKTGYCATVDLTEKSMPLILRFCRENGVPNKECDIFVSISTQSDSEIVDIPEIVNEMIKEFDCKLTFSFTVT